MGSSRNRRSGRADPRGPCCVSLLHERDADLPERHRLPGQSVSTRTCSKTSSSCAEWWSTKPHFSSTRLEVPGYPERDVVARGRLRMRRSSCVTLPRLAAVYRSPPAGTFRLPKRSPLDNGSSPLCSRIRPHLFSVRWPHKAKSTRSVPPLFHRRLVRVLESFASRSLSSGNRWLYRSIVTWILE
jgi:hypothetical protein